MSPLIPLGLALAALGLWLTLRLIRETRTRAQARASYFDAVKPLFHSGETRVQPTGFPRMTGRRDGLTFDLQAVPDTLTFRKLPALWVLITLPEPLPIDATLDLMARPSGNEPFTKFARPPTCQGTSPSEPMTRTASRRRTSSLSTPTYSRTPASRNSSSLPRASAS